jgi:hypothetical protein
VTALTAISNGVDVGLGDGTTIWYDRAGLEVWKKECRTQTVSLGSAALFSPGDSEIYLFDEKKDSVSIVHFDSWRVLKHEWTADHPACITADQRLVFGTRMGSLHALDCASSSTTAWNRS